MTVLLLALLVILLLVPNAKAMLLKAIIHTGLMNASAKKETILPAASFRGLSFVNEKAVLINTAELKGKMIFINFWATWCPPCVAEMSSINSLYNKLKTDTSIVFVLVDADNNFPASTAFMQKNKYDLPVYQLTSGIQENLFSGTLPTTLIIDSNGDIVQKHEGIANYDTEEMLEFLQTDGLKQ